MEANFNILLLIGIGIFFGLGGGKIFQWLKIPQVVGYITIGVLLGDSFLGLFDTTLIENLTPVNSFALGLIGFMIGGELKLDIFRKYGKSFVTILLWEGLLTFVLVAAAATLFTGKLYIGILFGALATATAPAATVDVLWEYKSKGILTTTILAIVALDDGLALIVYGFASAFAKSLMTGGSFSFATGFVAPLKEISLALVLGAGLGYFLYRILLRIHEREHFLVLCIGAILTNAGLASLFELDLILSSMMMGGILANLSPKMGKIIMDEVKAFTPPIYVLFFVLVGARLHIDLLPKMGLLGGLYVVVRMVGKVSGSYFGAVAAHADAVVKKYLGLTLFSQAGVAIGLAIAIDQSFGALGPEGKEVGQLVINVIAATTFIVQVIGPPCVKFGIAKAGEIGKDTTEEDVLTSCTVAQVMDSNVQTISSRQKLSDVMAVLRNSAHVHFPMINEDGAFQGVVSFQNVKGVMFNSELGDVLLAEDLVPDPVIHAYPDDPLKSAMDKFVFEKISFLPVLKSPTSKKLVGILHRRSAERFLKNRMLGKLQEELKADASANVADLLDETRISLELAADDKKSVIAELLHMAAQTGAVSEESLVLDRILERESQATTGIGKGIAIPHIRTGKVKNLSVLLGRSSEGVDFQAIDGKPAHLIFLMLAPSDCGENLLKLMGSLARLLNNEKLKFQLMKAESKAEIVELLKRHGENDLAGQPHGDADVGQRATC